MKTSTRILKTVTAVALVAALAIPVSAFAVPGAGTMGPKPNTHANAKNTAKRAAQMAEKQLALTARLDKVLANRARAFENAAGKIQSRIESATVISETLALGGADVTTANTQLAAASEALAAARQAELDATSLFKSVPTETDRRAAFRAAKAKAHEARTLLKTARAHLRDALLSLELLTVTVAGTVTP